MSRNNISKELNRQAQAWGYAPLYWNKNILLENGKTDTVAVLLLQWLTNKYRENKFSGEKLKISYKQITADTNLTREQASDAIARLKSRGLIKQTLERYWYEKQNGAKMVRFFGTDMYLEPVPKMINKISYKIYQKKLKYKRRKNKLTPHQRMILNKKMSKCAGQSYTGEISPAIMFNNMYVDKNTTKSKEFLTTDNCEAELREGKKENPPNKSKGRKENIDVLPPVKRLTRDEVVSQSINVKNNGAKSSNDIDEAAIKLFDLLWADYPHAENSLKDYDTQLNFSMPHLRAIIFEFGDRHTVERIAERILHDVNRIIMDAKKQRASNKRIVKKMRNPEISYFLGDNIDVIGDYVAEIDGFWGGYKRKIARESANSPKKQDLGFWER